MSKKIKVNLWWFLIIVVSLSVAGFAATRVMRRTSAGGPTLERRQRSKDRDYVRRSRLSPKLAMHLNALGNRLETPGKERLTITGELRSSAVSSG